ncbi:MAG: hypothetical protein M0R37_13665 [Bacteroidales bacterium]|jgi:hypothetical protein|nr:hypothetical protein [Sphaerochaeta sp.]MCK9629624.1 hypothetical protein [Bacteroidales bacterium]
MTIEVSRHAREESLPKRVGNVTKGKLARLVAKAWLSREKVPLSYTCGNEAGKPGIAYRFLMGQVWVFDVRRPWKAILVTVHPPASKVSRMKEAERRCLQSFNRHNKP